MTPWTGTLQLQPDGTLTGGRGRMSTPGECFEQLKPFLADLSHAIRTAPCNEAGLALMVATYAFTLTAETMGKDTFANAREVADLIVETMRPEAPKLKVVPA